MKKICIFGAVMFLAVFFLALNGCTTFDSSTGRSDSRTNNVSESTPTYRVDTPTLGELAGRFRSRDRTYHDSVITIFEDGEFVWNSRTIMAQIFRGQIYDLNADGFAVKLSDGSGDSFHFRFTPDKRGFSSLDESGNPVEEYRK